MAANRFRHYWFGENIITQSFEKNNKSHGTINFYISAECSITIITAWYKEVEASCEERYHCPVWGTFFDRDVTCRRVSFTFPN